MARELKFFSFDGKREDGSKNEGTSILDGVGSNKVELLQEPKDIFRKYFNGTDEEYGQFLREFDLVSPERLKSKNYLSNNFNEYIKKFYIATRSTKKPELTKHFSQKLNDLGLNRAGNNIYEEIEVNLDQLTDDEFTIVSKEFKNNAEIPAMIALIDEDIKNKKLNIIVSNKVLYEDPTDKNSKVYTTYQGQSGDQIRKTLSYKKTEKTDITKSNMNVTGIMRSLYGVFDKYLENYEFAISISNRRLGKSYFFNDEPSLEEIELLKVADDAAELHSKKVNETRGSMSPGATKEYVEQKEPEYKKTIKKEEINLDINIVSDETLKMLENNKKLLDFPISQLEKNKETMLEKFGGDEDDFKMQLEAYNKYITEVNKSYKTNIPVLDESLITLSEDDLVTELDNTILQLKAAAKNKIKNEKVVHEEEEITSTESKEEEIIDVEVIETPSEHIIDEKRESSLKTIAEYQKRLLSEQKEFALKALDQFKSDLLKGGGLLDNYEKSKAQLLKNNPYALDTFDALVKMELLNLPIKDKIIEEHKELISKINQRLNEKIKEYKELETSKADLVIEYKSDLGKANSKTEKLQKEYEKFVTTTEAELEEVQGIVNTLNETVGTQKTAIELKDKQLIKLPQLEEKINNQDQQINDLKDSFKIKEDLITNLKDKEKSQEKVIDELKDKEKSQEKVIDELKDKEKSQEKVIDELKDKEKSQAEKIEALHTQDKLQNKTIEDLNIKLKDQEKELIKLKSQEELNKSSLKELQEELEKFRVANKQLEIDKTELVSKLETSKELKKEVKTHKQKSTENDKISKAVDKNLTHTVYAGKIDDDKLKRELGKRANADTDQEYLRLTLIKHGKINYSELQGQYTPKVEQMITAELQDLTKAGILYQKDNIYTIKDHAKVLLLENFDKGIEHISQEWNSYIGEDKGNYSNTTKAQNNKFTRKKRS